MESPETSTQPVNEQPPGTCGSCGEQLVPDNVGRKLFPGHDPDDLIYWRCEVCLQFEITSAPVFVEVLDERRRAHLKHGATSMESCDPMSDRRFRVLAEEVGEVAAALNDREHDMAPGKTQEWYDAAEDHARAELRGELVQVAAMAVAWIAALDGEALS